MKINNSQTIGELLTLADASQKFSISYSRLHYFALKLGLQPVQQAGNVRLFNETQIQQLLLEIAASRTRDTLAAAAGDVLSNLSRGAAGGAAVFKGLQ